MVKRSVTTGIWRNLAEFGGIILSGRALVAILKVLVHREKQKEDVRNPIAQARGLLLAELRRRPVARFRVC